MVLGFIREGVFWPFFNTSGLRVVERLRGLALAGRRRSISKKNSRVSRATCLRGRNEQARTARTTCVPIHRTDDADPVARSNGGAGHPCCRQVRPCRSRRRRPQEHQGTGRNLAYAWLVAGSVIAGAREPRDLRRRRYG